ncbi:MAG: hypothetical protein GXO47_06555 [Chlorobi bacterium]|nr:hypothetical protein [Chlorobiota bacterium]
MTKYINGVNIYFEMVRRIKLLIFIFVLLSNTVFSQVTDINYRHLTVEDGLSMSRVLTVFQDSYGFMWFGCVQGLNRYDGRNITVMTSENYPGSTISSGIITGIDEGEDEKLYVAVYQGGLNVYDIKTNTFKSYVHSDDPNSLQSDFIHSVLYVDTVTVWLATDMGVSRFNPETGKITNYKLDKDFIENTSGFRLLSLYFDGSSLWVGTWGKGLMKFNPENGTFEYIRNDCKDGDDESKKNIVRDIIKFDDERLLIATEYGLYLFNRNSKRYEQIVDRYPFYEVVKDSKGDFWATSFYHGLYRITPEGGITNMLHNPYDAQSLPTDNLLGAYAGGGFLWFGSLSDGVISVNLNRKPFKHIYYVPGKPGLTYSSVYGIEEDVNHNVWFGTSKGLSVWNRRNNTFENISLAEVGEEFIEAPVWNIYKDGDRTMWLSTSDGLIKHDVVTGKQYVLKADPKNENSLVNNHVIYVTKVKENLWIGTANGLSRYVESKNEFINYKAKPNDYNTLSSSYISQIFNDSKDRLWVVTPVGICQYNYEKDNFIRHRTFINDTTEIVIKRPLYMTEDDKGRFWIGTNNGIYVCDIKKDRVEYIGKDNGLQDLYIYRMLEWKDNFWVSTNKGIAVIDKNTLRVTDTYYKKDGLQCNEFNPCSKKLHDGYFLFGGVKGVTGFYPDSIRRSQYVPEIYFTGLIVSGNDVTVKDPAFKENLTSNVNIIKLKNVYLDPKEKMYSFRFAAIDYNNPHGIKYFYRLLPVSSKWVPLEDKNFVTFIKLNPGDYRLEVKSTNGDGIVCNNTKAINVVVIPPLWKRTWFYFLEVLFVLLIIYLFLKLRTYKLNKDKKKLEKVVEQRTSEIKRKSRQIEKQKEKLEEFALDLERKVEERTEELRKAKQKAEESDKLKSAFLSNMSHEIRTPMNAILGFSELLSAKDLSDEEREMYAGIVKNNGDSLLALLNDIIDISMIESGQLKLIYSKVNIKELLNEVYVTFIGSSQFMDKPGLNMKLNFKCKDDVEIETDGYRLRQILNNLIGNAVKFTEKGEIEIGCEIKGDELLFYVKDTGIGIKPEYLERVFDRFYKPEKGKYLYNGNGLGLTITKSLTEALKGHIWVESEEGKGSVFYFTMPV